MNTNRGQPNHSINIFVQQPVLRVGQVGGSLSSMLRLPAENLGCILGSVAVEQHCASNIAPHMHHCCAAVIDISSVFDISFYVLFQITGDSSIGSSVQQHVSLDVCSLRVAQGAKHRADLQKKQISIYYVPRSKQLHAHSDTNDQRPKKDTGVAKQKCSTVQTKTCAQRC